MLLHLKHFLLAGFGGRVQGVKQGQQLWARNHETPVPGKYCPTLAHDPSSIIQTHSLQAGARGRVMDRRARQVARAVLSHVGVSRKLGPFVPWPMQPAGSS
jgi:hypothetical protein